MSRLIAEPIIPFTLWLSLAATAVIVWTLYTWRCGNWISGKRRLSVVALMAIAMSLPLLVLLNPNWQSLVPPPEGKPRITILIDESASMLTRDSTGQSRLDHSLAIAEQARQRWESKFDVRVMRFAERLRPASTDDAQVSGIEKTDIKNALAQASAEDLVQGQALMLISDGIHNGGTVAELTQEAEVARARGIPIYTSQAGAPVDVKNMSVSLPIPQEFAFVRQTIDVAVSVISSGLKGRTATVRLIDADRSETETSRVIDEKQISLDQGVSEIQFSINRDSPGLFRFKVQAEAFGDEVTADDNQATLLLRVANQPVRALLLEGKPYWDTKFLVRKLAEDQSIQLSSLVRVAAGRFLYRTIQGAATNVSTGGSDAADPQSAQTQTQQWKIINDAEQFLRDELGETQILIVGRDAEVFLSDEVLQLLSPWVARDGGSLVCSRGPPSNQIQRTLDRMLPVRWTTATESRFRIQLTEQGRQLRWLPSNDSGSQSRSGLRAMPSLTASAIPHERSAAARVLASTFTSDRTTDQTTLPMISFQPYGAGRTVVVEGAGMWRWALLSPEYSERDTVYAALWRNLVRWLVSRAALLPGEDIALQSDRASFWTTQSATATLLLRPEKIKDVPAIKLSGKTVQQPRTIQPQPVGSDPGVYQVDFGKLDAGSYTAQTMGKEAISIGFDVRDPWVERVELDPRDDVLYRIAMVSGGRPLDQGEWSEVAVEFERHLAETHPSQVRREPLWDRWWVLLAVLGLWASSWAVRRRQGLI